MPGETDSEAVRGETARSLRRLLVIGGLVVVVLVAGLGGWGAFASIGSAVVANAKVAVESSSKKIQHEEGGIIGAIHVDDGDKVRAGDPLITLDDTVLRANLAIVQARLDDYETREARLISERDGAREMTLPPELLARSAGEPRLADLIHGQRSLFAARRNAQEGQRAQLEQRVGQIQEEIKGLEAQRDAKTDEIGLIDQELVGLEELRGKELVPLSRVIALKRQKTGLHGEYGGLIGDIARAHGQISEIQVQLLQLDKDFQTDVATDLSDVRAKIAELKEQKIAAEDHLRKIEIRAPVDGYVHELAVHTVGGVLTPGETAMLIVPDLDALIIEAGVPTIEIDRIHVGQSAAVRFPAFNARVTPQLDAHVTSVSPDTVEDRDRGTAHYVVKLALDPGQLELLGKRTLIPGMPVEVFIKTGDRQVLSYLIKPITDQLDRAFREE